jgi:PqqD family protein of HPr-rel-A system
VNNIVSSFENGGRSPSGRNTVWRLHAEPPLPVRAWDGEVVVYNPLSGDTHLLDVLTGELLRVITARPADVGEVRAAAATLLDVPDDDRLGQHVGEALAALDEAGLIEPGTC